MKILINTLFFFTFFFESSWAIYPNDPIRLSNDEVNEIHTVVREIEKRCPPEDCVVIGIGQSPAPITAYLKATGKVALNIPLSGFRYKTPYNTTRKPLSPDLVDKLFKHFKNYFPGELIGNKRLLLVDFSTSGDSLITAKYFLEEYLKKEKLESQAEGLMIVSEIKQLESPENLKHLDVLPLKKCGKFLAEISASKYDLYSEFGSYYLEKPELPKEENERNLRDHKIAFESLVEFFRMRQATNIQLLPHILSTLEHFNRVQIEGPRCFEKSEDFEFNVKTGTFIKKMIEYRKKENANLDRIENIPQ